MSKEAEKWHDDCCRMVDFAVGRLMRLQGAAEDQQSEPTYIAIGQLKFIADGLKELAAEIDDLVKRSPVTMD